jgi:hypothetical protein
MFFNKPITVDLYTDDQHAYDMFKPNLSKHFIPRWWKKLPISRPDKHEHVHVQGLEVAGMKTCPAIIDIMKRGIIIPSPASFVVQRFMDGKLAFDVMPEKFKQPSSHSSDDYADHKPGYHHIKFPLPWRIKTSQDIEWLWMQPTWHQKNPLSHWSSPGTINFKYTHIAEFNFFLPQGSRLSLEPGDPIAQLIPLSDKSIKVNHHLVTTEEFHRLDNYKGWRVNNFKQRLRLQKEKGQ